MTTEKRFANRVITYCRGDVTHLKLQKLAFYAYGTILVSRREHEVGDIIFEAWPHGPVSPVLYEEYKDSRANPISPVDVDSYSVTTERAIENTVKVYDLLSAWDLRNQSHLEAPWINTQQGATIATEAIREHFSEKLTHGAVLIPEVLASRWSLQLDRIPAARFETLETLAAALS